METVHVLRHQARHPPQAPQLADRVVSRVGLRPVQAPPPEEAARPVPLARLVAAHELVEVDRSVALVLRVCAVGPAVVGEARGGREPRARQDDGFVVVVRCLVLVVTRGFGVAGDDVSIASFMSSSMYLIFFWWVVRVVGLGQEPRQRGDRSMSCGGRGRDDQGRREWPRVRNPKKRFGHAAVVSVSLCMTEREVQVLDLLALHRHNVVGWLEGGLEWNGCLERTDDISQGRIGVSMSSILMMPMFCRQPCHTPYSGYTARLCHRQISYQPRMPILTSVLLALPLRDVIIYINSNVSSGRYLYLYPSLVVDAFSFRSNYPTSERSVHRTILASASISPSRSSSTYAHLPSTLINIMPASRLTPPTRVFPTLV